MPNPSKKIFRRPALKRVKKVASKQFRRFFPQSSSSNAPEWLIKQVQLEDAAYTHGFRKKPYLGRRHSFEYLQQVPDPRAYYSFQGYMPSGGGMIPEEVNSSIGMSGVSGLIEQTPPQYIYYSPSHNPAAWARYASDFDRSYGSGVFQEPSIAPEEEFASGLMGPLVTSTPEKKRRPAAAQRFFPQQPIKMAKKTVSRQFRRLFPEKGSYNVAQYRPPVPDWFRRQVQLEDKAYEQGFRKHPYVGRRHSHELAQQMANQLAYRSFQGYMPQTGGMIPSPIRKTQQNIRNKDLSDKSLSLMDVSDIVDSEKGTSYATDSSVSVSNVSDIVRSETGVPSRSKAAAADTTAHRELMFMLDQLETTEIRKLQENLRQFQSWRRTLMFDVATLSATSSPPAALMKPTSKKRGAPGVKAIMPPR